MAATDADVFFPYDAGAGADVLEAQWRTMAKWWTTDGPVRLEDIGSLTSGTTGARSITVGPGRCWVRGAAGEFTGTTTVSFATNASGNPRVDLVVLRNDFVANKIQMDVLQGTPAGSPVAPTPTQNTAKWEVPLYAVTCANGFSAVAAGDIVDVRQWAQGRPPGGQLVAACAALRTTNQSIPSGVWTAVSFTDADDYDTVSLHNPSSNASRFTIPGGMTGLWEFKVNTAWAASAVNDRGIQIWKNGTVLRTLPVLPSAGGGSVVTVLAAAYEDVFAVGDYVEWAVSQDTGSALNMTLARATARFLGYVS